MISLSFSSYYKSPLMKRIPALLLTLFTLLLATACSDEGSEPQAGGGDTQLLTGITLQLGPGGVTATRGFGGDANAREHEFIHSLTVLVLNAQGEVELMLSPSETELGAEASQGNLVEKTFSNLTLTAGAKTIHALANIDGYTTPDGTPITDLIAQVQLGQRLPSALLSAVVEDPASRINANGDSWTAFIPMTAVQPVTLTTQNQTVRVEMVRLVSRIELGITNKKAAEAVRFTRFTMGHFAEAVSLFDQGTTSALPRLKESYTQEASFEVAPGTTSGSALSFYANATEDALAEPFAIEVALEGSTLPYQGNTARTDLPRNSILPLQLIFSDYEMKLDVQAQIAPIGGYPVEVFAANALTNNLSVSLPEGCSFSIIPRLYVGTLEDAGATVSWSVPDALSSWLQLTQQNTTQLQGIVSARSGMSGTITLQSVSSGGRKADYELTLTTAPIESFTTRGTPGHWRPVQTLSTAIFLTQANVH